MKENVEYVREKEDALDNVYRMSEASRRLYRDYSECQWDIEKFKQSYDSQVGVCELRNTALFTLKWSEVLALIAIGLIIYPILRKSLEKWSKKQK